MSRLNRKFARRREEGTALITAVLVTALMAVIAVELVDQTRFALFRTANVDRRDAAYWYAMGAREFSESVLMRSGPAEREVVRPSEPWLAGPQTFAIEDGALTGHVRDGNNCLNLNAMAGDGAEGAAGMEPGLTSEDVRIMFSVLLERLGADPGRIETVKAQIVDWIDEDSWREPGGAEDDAYRAFDPPLRAANQPMVEIEELLVLPAMTPELFGRIRPFVCVRPEPRQPPLNLNTLQLDQAVLLTALFGGRLTVGDAEAVLLQRPAEGYDDVEAFFKHAAIVALEPELAMREAVTLRSRWFEIDVTVRLDETEFSLFQTSELTPDGRMLRLSQRFGAVR